MGEFCHQLGSGGRVGIVTAHAIGRFERLILVRLLQVRTLDVMAIYAEGGRRLGEMKIEFGLADLPRLVRNVASFAAHVEGGMSAAFFGHIQPGRMAAEAEVFFLIPRGRLQQLILIVRGVRIVTLHAVSNCRGMDGTSYVGGIFVGVAGQTKSEGRGRDQLYPGDVFIHPNLVATGAAHGHRRMDRLAFCLVLMAGKAGGSVRLRIKWYRMFCGVDTASEDEHHDETAQRSYWVSHPRTRFEQFQRHTRHVSSFVSARISPYFFPRARLGPSPLTDCNGISWLVNSDL